MPDKNKILNDLSFICVYLRTKQQQKQNKKQKRPKKSTKEQACEYREWVDGFHGGDGRGGSG